MEYKQLFYTTDDGCEAESTKKVEELNSYRREKAREVTESVLLADGSNQHSASVQLVSAREHHSSTVAWAPNTVLHTGGEEREVGGRQKVGQ